MRDAVRSRGRSAQAVVRFAGSLLFTLLTVCASTGARAQPALPGATADSLRAEAAPLVVYGDTIAYFRERVAGITPQRRVEIAHERLHGLKSQQLLQTVRAEPVDRGYMVLVGDLFAFMFMESDQAGGPASPGVAPVDRAAQRLGRALRTRAETLAPRRRLAAVAWSVGATLLFIGLVGALRWLRRWLLGWIRSRTESRDVKLKLGDVDLLSHFTLLVTWLVRAAAQLGSAVLFVLWAVFVLNQFPETAELGALSTAALTGALRSFQVHLVGAIPGMIAVALIVFGARFATRLSGDLFAGAERGTLHLPGVHPETAHATRRLVTTSIWLFAVVVAYPLLPGSDSDAFKGVSVFLGLMVTLGSSGVMGHLMSGLVIVYSRALRTGDIVRVTDIEGTVTEVGALSVKLVNSRKEEFTIPNTVIVGTTVKNYSRLDRELGPALTTAVTIGYDAPWRVVYEILLAAAERTKGVRTQPAPIIFQPELSDFFVVYELTVRVEPGLDRYLVRTELHQNIQDAFNERGVQIMSPHFEGQPEGKVYVPKSKWKTAPDDLPAGPRREV